MSMDDGGEFLVTPMNCSKPKMRKAGHGPVIFKIAATFILLLLIVPVASIAASAQPVLYRHHIVMIQGDDPKTESIEPESNILVIERFGYLIPWNETYVVVPVPKGVHEMNLEQVDWSDAIGYYPGRYSAVMNPDNPPSRYFDSMEDMDCCVSSDYYWGFPEGADRNLSLYSNLNTNSDFTQQFDDVTSDDVWDISSDGLSLKPGNASGDYFSKISTASGVNITTFEMSWSIDSNEENATFAVSNNNGTDWVDVTQKKGEVGTFVTKGTGLVWRINMTQDPSINNTPVLKNLWINTTYTPWYSDMILQLGYVLQKDSDRGKFEVVMDLYDDEVNGVTPHMVIYINKDHEIVSDHLPLTLFETQTEYPDKDAYVFMTGTYSTNAPITIGEKGKEDEFPTALLLLLVLVALIIGIVLVTVLGKREKTGSPEAGEPVDSEEMEELRYKKEGLLLAIKKLESDYKEGLIDEDTYSDLRATYKARAVGVAKEMDALAAATAQPPVPDSSAEEEALLAKKEKLLKSIKKLDSEYDEGLLDEDVYDELRAGYKGMAMAVAKELEELNKS